MLREHALKAILAGCAWALLLLASSNHGVRADDYDCTGTPGSDTSDNHNPPQNAPCTQNLNDQHALDKKKPKLVASDDAYTLAGDQISVPALGILENDTYSDKDPLEVVLVRPPQHGTLDLGQQGDFVLQVESGYFGEDSFEYLLKSKKTESKPATVYLSMIDQEAPVVAWIAPVGDGERYNLREGQQIVLEVAASDNGTIAQVTFLRWDAVNEVYINLGNLDAPPFRMDLDASVLNPGWNQVFAVVSDLAGNKSDIPFIWIYKLLQGEMGNMVYLPAVAK